MKNIKLIKWLSELPKNYEVNISKYHVFNDKKNTYEIILDLPITGIAVNKCHKDIRFIIDSDEKILIKNFGKDKIIKKIKKE
ncbi:MAG: hypothetical protein PHF86_13550 [Candidatus Nanoarchaeia archaeon]|nr:hypothetical protein [Candidatus Nanoarchaeia archaeon]